MLPSCWVDTLRSISELWCELGGNEILPLEEKVKVKSLSRVRLFTTPWTIAYQAPPSMGFSRQEYWSGLPFPSPEELPNPGIEPRSPALQADTLTSEPPGKLLEEKPLIIILQELHTRKSTL